MLPTVLQVATGGGAAVAAYAAGAALARVAPTALRRSPVVVSVVAGSLAAAGAAFGGPATGGLVTDAAVNGLLVGLMALGSVQIDRLLALALAGVAFVFLGGSLAAGAAVGLALVMVTSGHRLLTFKAGLGGLVGIAIVSTAWDGPEPLAAGAATVCVVAVWAGAFGRMSSKGRHRMRWATVGAVGAAVVAVLVFGVALVASQSELERSADLATAGLAQVRAGDQETATESLVRAAAGFASADRRLSAWWGRAIDAVPVAAQNARAVRAMSQGGRHVSREAVAAARAGDPGALNVTGARVPLDTVERFLSALARVVAELRRADSALGATDSPWLLGPVDDARHRLEAGVADALPPASQALQVLRVVPGLFGATEQRRYFLALQTPSEQRASGGVMGTYGLLAASGGALTLEAVGSETDLNVAGTPPRQRRLIAPEDYVRRYGGYRPEWFWQNVTMSPDFPTVGKVIQGLFPQSGGPEVDGVIALDPTGLARLLSVIGPIDVAGWPVPLTADNAEQVLLFDEYVRFAGRREARHDFLENVVRATYDRLAATTLPGPRRLAEVFASVARAEHLMLYSGRAHEQATFRRIRADGAIRPVRGDYLAVATQNSSGNKIDWYFRRKLRYDVRYDPVRGSVVGTISVTLRNMAPAGGVTDDIIGSVGSAPTPRGHNRMLVSVYTPLEATATTVDGAPVTVERGRELDRNVISAFITVPPMSERTFAIEVRGTPGGRPEDYLLDLDAQALVAPEELTLTFAAPPGWLVTPPDGWVQSSRSSVARFGTLGEAQSPRLLLTRLD